MVPQGRACACDGVCDSRQIADRSRARGCVLPPPLEANVLPRFVAKGEERVPLFGDFGLGLRPLEDLVIKHFHS
jgi:hypothetical protein